MPGQALFLDRNIHKRRDNTVNYSHVFLFSCFTTIVGSAGDPFLLSNGYGFLWIAILYLIGAWLKKCNIPKKIQTKKAIILSIICILLTWINKIFMTFANGALTSYLSPTILILAILNVILFSKIYVHLQIPIFFF